MGTSRHSSSVLSRLEVALQHISHGLCMYDANGRLVLCNDRFRKMYGLPADIGPGSPFRAIMQAQQLFPLDVAEAYAAEVETEGGLPGPTDVAVTTKHGEIIRIIRQRTADGGWVSTHENVTEQARAETELSRIQTFLTTVIESVPTGIVVKDIASGKYQIINKAAERIFGHTTGDFIGKTIEELLPKGHASSIAKYDKQLVESGGSALATEAQVQVADEPRILSTQRVVVRDPAGAATHIVAVINDVTEQRRTEAMLVHMAHHDPLTDLANRTLLASTLEEEIERSKESYLEIAVFMLDLDLFKQINDSLGHAVGDIILKMTAERLQGCLHEGEMSARLGGDEFAVLQFRTRPNSGRARVLAKRILDAMSRPFDLGDWTVSLSTSIGIAVAPQHGADVDTILKRADLALYDAKSKGRGSYSVFKPKMETEAHARHLFQQELPKAIEHGDLELHYQPVVDTLTGSTVCLEALVRWRHRTLGLIAPGEFIPVAEQGGLITKVGEWILMTALAQAARWPDDIKVAINLSPVQFRESDLLEVIINGLSMTGVKAGRLELEITESLLLESAPERVKVLHRLRNLGISIVLDDFGTGYSSLSYLRSFPFDKIKIDRSFVAEISTNRHSAAIISATTGLARSLDIRTVAEGVETAEQFVLLQAAGVDEIQGYLISPPVTEAVLIRRGFQWRDEVLRVKPSVQSR